MAVEGGDRDYVRSLERGFAVLLAFDEELSNPTLAELASATGFSRPAVRRLLITLQRLGYVANEDTRWRLTPRVLSIGQHFPATERVQANVSAVTMFLQVLRPLFILWAFCMVLTASTELGTNAWMESVLKRTAHVSGTVVFVYMRVLVFASQGGAASRVLGWKPFLFLGTVSYSIYMVHYFIAYRVLDAVLLGRSLGLPGIGYLGSSKLAGDLLLLAYLAIVVAVSAATYRLIEAPARERFRRMAHAAHRGLHGERPA